MAAALVSADFSLCVRPTRSARPCLHVALRKAPRLVRASARSEGDGSPSQLMTVERALEVLKLPSTATFEEVLRRKNELLERHSGDQDKAMAIEMAYDLLFMQNMKRRLTGELEVSTSVRYADVPAAPTKKSGSPARAGGQGGAAPPAMRAPSLPKLSMPSAGGLGLAIKAPRNSTVTTTQGVVFASLAAWALVGALLEGPEQQLNDTAGLQLAMALIYSIYTLKENKGMQIGKAMGVSLACLMAGGVLGTLVEAWLRVDIVPLGNFSSPGVLVAEFIIAACAAGAVFLV